MAKCSFCRLLKSCRTSDEASRNRGEYKTRYLSALIKKTTYINAEGEEIPSGQVTFGNIPLNFCPECGKKIDPEQVDAPPMSCHEDAYLNSLCGKRVAITFFDNSEEEGIFQKDTLATYTGLKDFNDKRVIGYRIVNGTHFKKAHIKHIEEAAL